MVLAGCRSRLCLACSGQQQSWLDGGRYVGLYPTALHYSIFAVEIVPCDSCHQPASVHTGVLTVVALAMSGLMNESTHLPDRQYCRTGSCRTCCIVVSHRLFLRPSCSSAFQNTLAGLLLEEHVAAGTAKLHVLVSLWFGHTCPAPLRTHCSNMHCLSICFACRQFCAARHSLYIEPPRTNSSRLCVL